MTDNTGERAATTHMLCCSCGMYFWAAASSEKYQGSMNFEFQHRAIRLNAPVWSSGEPANGWMTHMLLDVGNDFPGIGLVPAPV